MPTIPVVTPLGYVGVFFLIAGFFFVIAGLGILQVEKVTVRPGKKTWQLGLIIATIGLLFLSPDIINAFPSPTLTPTVTPVNSLEPSTQAPPSPTNTLSPTLEVIVPLVSTATVTSLPTSTESAMWSDGEILFQDDFEDGNLDNWLVHGGQWQIIQEETGNHALEGQDVDFARIEAGRLNWENYALEVTFKIVDKSKSPSGEIVNLFFRDTPNCNRYDLIIFSTWINLQRQNGDNCNSKDLEGQGVNLPFNEWVTFRVEITNDIIRCVVDEVELFLIRDSQPHTKGAISLAVQENGRVLFDNVKVIELLQP